MPREALMSELLTRVNRPIDLGEDGAYPLVGVRLNGRGAFLREEKLGLDIKKKRHYIVAAGDVVYNKLFAWRGAFALVGPELDGFFVSDKFPTYRISTESILPDYLAIVFRSPSLAKQAEVRSVGLAAMSKFTLNPPKFAELRIILPSLIEQKRFVRLFAALSAERDSILLSTQRISDLIAALRARVIDELSREYPRVRMGDLGEMVRRSITVRDDVSYRQVTVAMGNRGLRLRGEAMGTQIGVKNQAVVQNGDVVFSRIDLRNGAIGFVPADLDGAIVSNDFPVFSLGSSMCRDFAELIFQSADFRTQSVARSAGSTNRRKVKRNSFLDIEVPLPPAAEQRTIVARAKQVSAETQIALRESSSALDRVNAAIQSLLATLAPRPAGARLSAVEAPDTDDGPPDADE